ncbi:Protein of unknown function (DUF1644) [Melia azedarach]|uniref:Uncharacterized protein n=2 Tax=Melia azedarach TaxID=155640 RepID=A0ACC1Y3P2_MELAZ|nr:Protein of unknown function (DUF1644) [Melia azedarach]KAJ4718327.1 Protein of unknown function (DUF1644) [Melia azedarach]
MPKDRRVRSLSLERSRSSPYPCSSSSRDAKQCKTEIKTEISAKSVEDEREWEEAMCPICLEHPHNAVLLQCSSFEKGCRPYMCDTSYRHSNCLDQFFKTSESTPSCPSTEIPEEIPATSMNSSIVREEASALPGESRRDVRLLRQYLMCPLCRGEIHGYLVVEAARQFMNSKVRSCSCEDCDFSGTYSELRRHARSEHPYARPTDVDPLREHGWRRLENLRNLREIVGIVRAAVGEIRTEDLFIQPNYDNLVRSVVQVYLFYESQGIILNSESEEEEEVRDNRSERRERLLRFRRVREANLARRQRLINELQSVRIHGGRQNTETGRSPREINSFRAERAHSEETDWAAPRQNDTSQPCRSWTHQGLRWRGQRRSRSSNSQR